MSDIKSVIDFFVNLWLTIFNTLRDGMGVYFLIWIAVVTIIPLFRRILKSLRS